MSVMLQDVRTRKYVKSPDGWTEDPDDARQFGGGTDALFYCCRHQLNDMRILGRFEDRQQDFTIRLRSQSFE